MTASKLCSAIRLQKPSWSQRLVVGDKMERPLPYKKHCSMKDDLEPLCLIVHLVAHPVGLEEWPLQERKQWKDLPGEAGY
jgi:hypothetical protein